MAKEQQVKDRISYETFCENYNKWKDSCLEEFNQSYGEKSAVGYRTIHTAEGDYEPGELVEFAEDGDAYPHSVFGTGHIKRAVTPWEDSPFYCS